MDSKELQSFRYSWDIAHSYLSMASVLVSASLALETSYYKFPSSGFLKNRFTDQPDREDKQLRELYIDFMIWDSTLSQGILWRSFTVIDMKRMK